MYVYSIHNKYALCVCIYIYICSIFTLYIVIYIHIHNIVIDLYDIYIYMHIPSSRVNVQFSARGQRAGGAALFKLV